MGSTNDVLHGDRLSSPVKLSPSKLSMNHGAFMANIQNGHSPVRDASPGASSSSRVIEVLHNQIDNLTRTNLELMVQSNNLLSRLETANSTHGKQLESYSTLKYENDNLNLMLSRKERRVRELEEQSSRLKNSYEEATVNNKTMHSRLQKFTQRESEREEQFQMVQAQYDALLDAQGRYREQYSREVQELRSQLQDYKAEQEKQVSGSLKALLDNNAALQGKVDEYAEKFQKLAAAQEGHAEVVDRECNSLRSQLDSAKWENLYQESCNAVLDFASHTGRELSASFLSQHGRGSIKSEVKSPQTFQEGQRASLSPNLGSSSGFVNPQQIRVPKTRNSSSAKRSSFYGTNVSIPASPVPGVRQASSSPATAPSGTLPGVRRSSSIRSSTPNSRSSSGEHPSSENNTHATKTHTRSLSSQVRRKNSTRSRANENGPNGE
ncbi:LAFA_0G10616g1_1 [Lachancea sp. 'fantastica']|nr:LAFA_0G10616g1_1 [Lachancea sp. 'fantastica']